MSHVPVGDFDQKYRLDADPWRFATSHYERRRYDMTVASLPDSRYRRGFEPACAIGELTWRLAARCHALVATEPSPAALQRARDRCRYLHNVALARGELPNDWPEGTFDLVVLSELGYYFTVDELRLVRDRAVAMLDPGGCLVAVHWRGHSPDHVLHGDEVHEELRAAKGVEHAGEYVDAGFRLDLWRRT